MFPFKRLGILITCLFLVIPFNSATSENAQKEHETVSAIINHLNENPNSAYIYKEGQLVDSQLKDDKQEIKKLAKVAAKELGIRKSKIHIISSKKLTMDDTYYRLKLTFDEKSCTVIMRITEGSDIQMMKSKCKDLAASQIKRTPRSVTISAQDDEEEVGLPGGIRPLNDIKSIKHYLSDGLDYLDTQSSHPNRYKIQQIVDASTQVVAGQLIRVKAKVILSDCEKGSNKSLEQCSDKKNAESKLCYFKIWSRPWLPNSCETNITCENETQIYSFRSKRETIQEDNLENLDFVNQELFGSFMATYNKKYLNKVEYSYRFKVFKDNLNTIRFLNKVEQGTATYGITQFADLTKQEFSKRHGLRWDLQSENDIPFAQATIPDIELPTEFDWRTKNAVTKVKDQGSCGSCWAFSTTGNIEGQYAIKYKSLLEFSEQELVDCDKTDDGCDGGLMDNAYRAIEKLGGLETEQDYPYDAEDEKCHFSKNKVKVQISGALNISHDETDMAKWLVQNGPISIAINANAMQFYAGGISHPWKVLCNPKNLDHGVLIVGYGVHTYPRFNKTLPYWIVKNSWGPSWGEQGYYRVYRGDGTCGLNQTPSSAIVA